MVGRAVETTVWSSAARNIPSMSAPMMMRTRRWVRASSGSWSGSVAVSVMVGTVPLGYMPNLGGWRSTRVADAWKAGTMITGVHSIVYAEDADAARAFIRDVLGFPFVDAHDGWLIFGLPPGELGVHPAAGTDDGTNSAASGRHELYLLCDDIDTTVEELSARGVEFVTPIEDQGFGRLTRLRVPGAGELGIYQPSHATAFDR